jgi:hypothetical protein
MRPSLASAARRAAQHRERVGRAGAGDHDRLAAVHEQYFEELADMVSRSARPDPEAIGNLRSRYDTEQISALQTSN